VSEYQQSRYPSWRETGRPRGPVPAICLIRSWEWRLHMNELSATSIGCRASCWRLGGIELCLSKWLFYRGL
jgi:hypothetical protein